MPNRLSTFFSQWRKGSSKNPSDPAKSPFSLGQVVLKELADCKNELAEVKRQLAERPVQTHFAEDHEEIQNLVSSAKNHNARFDNVWEKLKEHSDRMNAFQAGFNTLSTITHPKIKDKIDSLNEALKQILIRVDQLEEAHFKTLSSRISSASWQRPRHKDGRFAKRNGAGDDAR